jgi:hypothetical protein
MCSRIQCRCFSKSVNEGIPGRLVPCDIAWRAVFSFVASCCFACTSFDEGIVDIAEGAIVWMRLRRLARCETGIENKKGRSNAWQIFTVRRKIAVMPSRGYLYGNSVGASKIGRHAANKIMDSRKGKVGKVERDVRNARWNRKLYPMLRRSACGEVQAKHYNM